MIYLVDMDGVITNFEKTFLDKWKQKHSDKPFIPLNERNTFLVRDQYPRELKELVDEIYYSKRFYASLPLIPRSREALQEMIGRGYEVFICTSPLRDSKYCMEEKFEWVEKNLGPDWLRRLIVTHDKTIIMGNILIDDKPEVEGIEIPSWEHVLYTQPYNLRVTGKRRLTWENWKSILIL